VTVSDTEQESLASAARETTALRLRAQRVALAAGGAFLTVAMTAVFAWGGYLPYRAAALYTAVVTALCTAFYALVRSGASRRFADPSLTVPQLVSAGLIVSYVVYEGYQARPAFLAMYIVAYMFGVFGLRRRGLLSIAIFYQACYVAVVVCYIIFRPDVTDVRREMFRIVGFALFMTWLVILGSDISGLRQRLHETNVRLTQALVRAEELANHDVLTGCLNRRRMMELLTLEALRAERGSPFSLGLVDLDHFKALNDDFGHLSGDVVLKHLSRRISVRRELRKVSIYASFR
jgi:predicted signal transduction protein with EAL and GGDEF domain